MAVGRSVVCVAIATACGGNARDGATSTSPRMRGDLPCEPRRHAYARRGEPLFEGYRFIAGSSDGRRVALVTTHMGPGSGQPVGGVHVLEASATKEVLGKSYFQVTGAEGELPKVEQGILADYAGELAAVGVEVGRHVPAQQPWCADAAGRLHLGGARELRLDVTRAPCPDDPKHQAVAWQVCSRDGARCARGGPSGCLDGSVMVADLYRLGEIDWVVVDLATRPFPDIDFHLFQAVGGALTGS